MLLTGLKQWPNMVIIVTHTYLTSTSGLLCRSTTWLSKFSRHIAAVREARTAFRYGLRVAAWSVVGGGGVVTRLQAIRTNWALVEGLLRVYECVRLTIITLSSLCSLTKGQFTLDLRNTENRDLQFILTWHLFGDLWTPGFVDLWTSAFLF